MKKQKNSKKIPANKKPVQKNKKLKGAQKRLPSEQMPKENTLPPALFSEEILAKPDMVLMGKSGKFRKCHACLHDAKSALAQNEAGNAKKSYIEARSIYIGLEYAEKKELYRELMEIYNKLSGLNQE